MRMIEDFFDEATHQTINLKNLNQEEAIRHLISQGVNPDLAADHVDFSIEEFRTRGLCRFQVEDLMQRFNYHMTSVMVRSHIYDYQEICYPENYPVEIISIESYIGTRRIVVSFATQNPLSLLSLRDLLTSPSEQIYHDKQMIYPSSTNPLLENHISIYLEDTPNIILNRIKDLFKKLASVKLLNQDTIDYKDAIKKCCDFTEHYFKGWELGLPAGNYFIRLLMPILGSPPTRDQERIRSKLRRIDHRCGFYDNKTGLRRKRFTKVDIPKFGIIAHASPLYKSIKDRDTNYLLTVLRRGEKLKEFDEFGVVEDILPFPSHKKDSTTTLHTILTLFSLWLDYGLSIDKGFSERTLMLSIIVRATFEQNHRENFIDNLDIWEHLINRLMIIDGNRTYSYISKDLEKNNPFAKLVAEGQHFVEQSKSPKKTLVPNFSTTIEYFVGNKIIYRPRRLNYFLNQQTKLTIETFYISEILQNTSLINSLYDLFKNHPQWQGVMNEHEITKYFVENILDLKGNVYFDLVKAEGVLVGYNVAEIRVERHNEKDILIHHVKLAVTHQKFSEYKGLMLFISHHRGFLPLENNIACKTITVFEAASPASLLAIEFLDDYYPKKYKLEKYTDLLFATIYKEEKNNKQIIQDEINHACRIKDPLARFAPSNTNARWKTRTMLAANRFFSNPIHQNGESIIVIYKNNRTNFTLFQAQLAKFIKLPGQAALSSLAPTAKF